VLQVYRLALAVLLLLLGVASFWYLRSHSPTAPVAASIAQAPMVSVINVTPKQIRIPIDLNGMVTASNQVMLAANSAGQITDLSPRLIPGATFQQNEVLLSMDDGMAQRQLSAAQLTLETAKQNLQRLKAEQQIDQALPGLPNVVQVYLGRLQEMQTQIDLAQADLHLAQEQLEQTEIRAPFDGRVQQVMVSAGQRVAPGMELVSFYGTGTARVRLAISDSQLLLMNLPQDPHTPHTTKDKISTNNTSVLLRQNLAGQYRYWQGHLLGIEASLDPNNQMTYLLVNVDQAFDQNIDINNQTNAKSTPNVHLPLLSGQVLEARIMSRAFKNIAVIPRQLLQSGNVVWGVDADNRLYRQTLQVLYTTTDKAYVHGLKSQQNLVSSVMNLAIEGMRVRVQGQNNTDAVSISPTPTL
jgi:RND family efflux transporter MFP subunit